MTMFPVEFQPDNALWFLIGAALGAIAGWSLQAMRYAKRAASKVERIENEMRDDDKGAISWESLGIGIMVTCVAVAAVFAGIASEKSDDANDRLDRTVTCLLGSFTDQTRALNQRTTFSAKASRAERAYLRKYQNLLEKVADPDAPPQEQVRALDDAAKATAERLRLIDKVQDRRESYPYPEASDVRECAEMN